MASEPPGGGQQKKLHPLFAPQKASRPDNGNGEVVGTSEIAIEPSAPQQAAPPAAPQQNLPRQTTQLLPTSSDFNSPLPQPTQLDALPASTPDVGPAPPAPVNAFALLQQPKKKTVEVEVQTAPPSNSIAESTTQAAEPKRRGRPPKKRKSSPPPPPDAVFSSLETGLGNSEELATNQNSSTVTSTSMSTPAAEPMDIEPSIKKDSSAEPPKRVLRFNPKTGTIGSPPKPKDSPPRTSKSKGKAAVSGAVSGPLVVPYPSQDPTSRTRIGEMIESVLSSKSRRFPVAPQITPTKSTTAKGKASASAAPDQKQLRTIAPVPTPKSDTPTVVKTTHPFFTGARTKGAAAKDGSSGTPASAKSSANGSGANYYTSTPCSPRRRAPQPSAMFRMPQFGAKNGILRVPGAQLPAWPWRGAVHTRPEGDFSTSPIPSSPSSYRSISSVSPSPPPSRKRKCLAIDIRKDELILERAMQSLNIQSVMEDIKDANADDFTPPPPELRLPQRHVESGPKLQARISPQLRTNDPGLNALFASISTTLSAFDQHQCESSSWAQKYAPSCAIEVLQSGQEPVMLKNWLEALKVVAVDTGAGDGADSKGPAGAKGKARKKRKKNKLDGFIVSSDDDDDGTGETSENEADWSASGRYGLVKNTVVRSGSLLDKAGRAGARLTNAVVISGPHGCGKSAAVYAVAKELGFEVFEINASSRRSGKDVIDRIGDMTRNHLVQHKNKKQPKIASTEASEPMDDYDMDLEDADGDPDPDFPMPEVEILLPNSKKQPTMSSFFKSAGGGSAKQATEPETKASQKQSLILLEEADLLYEEDKQFWATVMSLMAQSKRPFVITCNDETLLPLQSLLLHAIFRFTAPPTDVAVDRLIMIAACEGHALQRKAVESLYEVRNRDFRAALADLQFWCQIGVGDRRGGFDWFYQRWPEGVDADEHGHVMRVVSSDTYQEGMGWLNNDTAASKVGAGGLESRQSELQDLVQDDLVQQAWNDWKLDMGQWQDSLNLTTWAGQLESCNTDNHRRHLLETYDDFTNSMSDADLVSSSVFATGNRVPFDATQPELPYKAREDYILGQQLLERTTVAHELDDLRLPMVTTMRCAAKRALQAGTTAEDKSVAASTLDALDVKQLVSGILKEHVEPHGLIPSDSPALRRIDLSMAFDPIAVPSCAPPSTGYYSGYFAPSASATSSSHLEPSIFDRNVTPIVVDVAPFVRGIIAHEGRLQKQRQKTSSFFSESASAAGSTPLAGATSDSDGSSEVVAATSRRRPPKRVRTTRAAMSALDGGSRSAARKERWFDNADVNPVLVMRTGGDGWDAIVEEDLKKLGQEAAAADARDAEMAARRAAEHEAAAAAAAAFVAAQASAAPVQQLVPPPSAVLDQGIISSAPFTGVESAPMGLPPTAAHNDSAPPQNDQQHRVPISSPAPPEAGHPENNPKTDS